MLVMRENTQIYLCDGIVDMRKSIDGLAMLVSMRFDKGPQTGDVFVFRNKACDKVKLLYWDRNGFILHYKRLEKGRFRFTNMPNAQGSYTITKEQLAWLMAGFDFQLMSEFPELKYENYF